MYASTECMPLRTSVIMNSGAMPVLALLLAAAAYGSCWALYDLYRVLLNLSNERPDFLPPTKGATVRAPKTPLPGGGTTEAVVEIDGSAASQIP